MRYQNIQKAAFLARPNRFIAQVVIDGQELTVHVKNTGRCKELLVPGCTVYLEKSDNPARKTAYDLVAVEKVSPNGTCRLINMDSQAPNRLFKEWAEAGSFCSGLSLLRPETTWGHSRFDFYWQAGDRKGFVEVKGCTLEEDNWTWFPDAPTERGVKRRCVSSSRWRGWMAFLLMTGPTRPLGRLSAGPPSGGWRCWPTSARSSPARSA